ncbi:hypothetical protein LTR62_004650 [Meristemomyces frigidus]|uniref:Enoyl reductase (ER) domain-containing protein n=1 Tax=Meristemomyces frigidus TaxID=1508187 RepID=A0AAN7TQK9_9PEZI|nr:hypothetical protein LTR62_004650 [Meristemomyces frigidus]
MGAPTPPTERTQAIVATFPAKENHTPGSNWSLQDVNVATTLTDGELLVEMLATGICHSDLSLTSSPRMPYPRIAGHEGAGHIKTLGPNMANKELKVGDPVLLSFMHCGKCPYCLKGRPSQCVAFMANLPGRPGVFSSAKGEDGEGTSGEDIIGGFFGQSSFARLSVVQESCVVPAKDLVKDDQELKLFSPLGCGYQTGAGAVLNIAKPSKEASIVVAGLGGVGLAAIMAAKIVNCKEIIGLDRLPSRMQICKDLGATHSIDTSSITDLSKTMKDAANGGRGPDFFIDTTGAPAVLEAGFQALAPGGTMVFIGADMNPANGWAPDYRPVMSRSLKLIGCVEGDSEPAKFVPELVKYYREGRFPIDKMTQYYKAADFKTALHDMHSGDAIKAVLEW